MPLVAAWVCLAGRHNRAFGARQGGGCGMVRGGASEHRPSGPRPTAKVQRGSPNVMVRTVLHTLVL